MIRACNIRYLASASALIVAVVAQAASAQAVDAASQADAPVQAQVAEDENIVVTGALIRGIARVVASVVNLNSEQIVATGATTANEILANIPQLSNIFLQGPNPGRPILRSLGASADPDLLPPAVIERVELVLDGGSFGRDRDFVRQATPNVTGACPPGTVITNGGAINGNACALPGGAPGVQSCDITDSSQFAPESDRHAVFAGFNQDITDAINFDVRGFYSRKKQSGFQGIVPVAVTITPTNPYFVPALPPHRRAPAPIYFV